jgi:hypothetical protein
MAIIAIKSAKPYIEKLVQAKGIKDNIKVGIRVYSDKELKDIRKDYLANFSTVELTRKQAQLDALKSDITLSDEDFSTKVGVLENAIETLNESILSYQKDFTKSHISYIKNASVAIDSVDTLIPDTREAKPIESLWNTPDECLAVLLDMYLESPFFKDSLSIAVTDAVFKTDIKGEELGN